MNRRTVLLTTVFPRAFMAGMATTVEAVNAARDARLTGASMPGDEMLKRSPDSAAMVDYWDTVDAIVDGVEAMRLHGPKFLPKFANEDDKDYRYRLRCTKLTNIYRDSVESLASKPFEKEVTLEDESDDETTKPIPEALTAFVEDVDGSGNNLSIFAGATFFNGINSAIDWIFVDQNKPDPTIRSVADAKAAGIRPYWSHVLGRNVLEARSEVLNGNETLTYIRIFEPGAPDHVRVFERSPQGVVTWKLYQKSDRPSDNGKTHFVEIDSGVVTIGVIPLTPFWTGRRDGRSWRFFPAMRDAADLQVELYQEESALKYLKKLAAYPMLAGNGVAPMKDSAGNIIPIAVGPSRVLYSPPNGNGDHGEWTYVEPAATTMKFLAEDIKETIQQLRELARQPLTAQSGNLTVITTAIAAGKAKSAVSAWALNLKNALENAFVITCLWLNIKPETYDPVVAVYTDFDEFMDGKDVESLDADRDRGDISQETLWEEKKRRGIYSEDFTAERERERLTKELPGDGEDTDPDVKPGTVRDPRAPKPTKQKPTTPAEPSP